MSSPLDPVKRTHSQGSIGILGAGLLGRLLAVQLVASGWSVHIFEKDSPHTHSSCGHVGAGMLAPFAELETGDTLVFQLGVDSLALWPKMIENLVTPVFFQQAGSLVVSHPQDVSELQRFQTRIEEKLSHLNQDLEESPPFEILMGADI
ncbi:MAG: FAD-dependent oxidoreductase, partial [Cyanobacteria bacterium]|nr:FAD-dependent oxidoreductase [Cyanobacteriota bacterium]